MNAVISRLGLLLHECFGWLICHCFQSHWQQAMTEQARSDLTAESPLLNAVSSSHLCHDSWLGEEIARTIGPVLIEGLGILSPTATSVLELRNPWDREPVSLPGDHSYNGVGSNLDLSIAGFCYEWLCDAGSVTSLKKGGIADCYPAFSSTALATLHQAPWIALNL